MNKSGLFEVFERLEAGARESGVKIVLMGGLAVSIYAAPRATFDIDGIIDLDEGSLEKFLDSVGKRGFKWDDTMPIKRIKGLPFITLLYPDKKIYIDLFLAKSGIHRSALKRSRSVKVEDVILHVISPEDLILIKLLSDRPRDTEDVRQILLENSGILDLEYLEKWAGSLGVLQFLKDELRSVKAEGDKPEE